MSGTQQLDAYYFFEHDWDAYEDLRETFEWEIPAEFNMADYVVDRWANQKARVALFQEDTDGTERAYTFWQLSNYTNQLANYFAEIGIEAGDRIGVYLSRKPETAIAHIAAWKLGVVSIPLSPLFGPDALSFRLADCDVKAVVTDEFTLDTVLEVERNLDMLEQILTVSNADASPDTAATDLTDFWTALLDQSRSFETVSQTPDDPAMIFYTSGTTGEPKGVLHGHGILLGHLPLFAVMFCNMEMNDDDLLWVPADWAWVASLFNILFPAWFYGLPVLAHETQGFDPETAFELIEKYGVTIYHAIPTALRIMMQVDATQYDVSSVRLIDTGGESVGQSIVDWTTDVFEGADVHVGYGQTEANMLIGNSRYLYEYRSESIGKPAPGQEITLLDPDTGEPTVEPGEVGEFATRYEGNPVCFKEYWNRPEKTSNKITNGWLLTEDLGRVDDDGYYYFESRKDDVIISAGYRIGPAEIEESLAKHDAVTDAGVIGIPDDERGEIPKAFIVLAEAVTPSDELKDDLRGHVRSQLAKYEYPRAITFVDSLPTTTTGKVRRFELRKREQSS